VVRQHPLPDSAERQTTGDRPDEIRYQPNGIAPLETMKVERVTDLRQETGE